MAANLKRLTIESIQRWFDSPVMFMSPEQAACYLCFLLQTEGEFYGLSAIVRTHSSSMRLSDTVCYQALDFLIESNMVTSSWDKKRNGRGRPRRMFKIADGAAANVKKLAVLWQSQALGREAA